MRDRDSARRKAEPSSTATPSSSKKVGKGPSRKKRDRDAVHATGPESAGEGDEAGAAPSKTVSHIRNKMVRSQQYHKLKHEKNKEKKKLREKKKKEEAKLVAQGLPVPEKPVPHTIDNQRVVDETFIGKDATEEVSARVADEEKDDEFAEHFANARPPHVLLTTGYNCSKIMYRFLSEMLEVFPSATYYKRKGYSLKKIIEYAKNRDFTDVVVFNEDRKQINGMIVVHLPDGPTAFFRLSSLVLSTDIKGHGRATSHKPELVLNNFSTMLGHRVGRMFASLFCQDPNFKGRRVVAFHNQRDFIFFRHHRYIFEEKEKKADGNTVKVRLQGTLVLLEASGRDDSPHIDSTSPASFGTHAMSGYTIQFAELGPRFTLRLEQLQKGTMDKGGEFEWLRKPGSETGKSKFAL